MRQSQVSRIQCRRRCPQGEGRYRAPGCRGLRPVRKALAEREADLNHGYTPSLDLILGKNDVGIEAWKPQILGRLIAEVGCRRRWRQHFRNERGRFCSQVFAFELRAIDHDDVGISDRPGSDIDPELGQHPPPFAVKACPQQLEQVADDECVRVPPVIIDDAALRQLESLLAPLHPGKERGLVHLQIRLNIHGRLIASYCSGNRRLTKRRGCVLTRRLRAASA